MSRNRYCKIEGCSSIIGGDGRTHSQISFSGDDFLKHQWLQQIQTNNKQNVESLDGFKICEKHFRQIDLYSRASGGFGRNKGSYPVYFPKTNPEDFGVEPDKSQEFVPVELYNEALKNRDEIMAKYRHFVYNNYNNLVHSKNELLQAYNDLLKENNDLKEMLKRNEATADFKLNVASKDLSGSRKLIRKLKQTNRSQRKSLVTKEKRIKNQRAVLNLLGVDETKPENLKVTNGTRILNAIRKGRSNRYLPEVRTFAFTAHFAGRASYNYIREVFDKALPAENTMRSWFNNVNCKPGHIEEAFEHLKRLVSSTSIKHPVNVIFDEMAIKQHIQYIKSERKFSGYTTYGTDEPKPATKAIVFMVSGLSFSFKLPVSYQFIDSLKGPEKAALIDEVICKLIECGLDVRSVTSDGDQSNISAFKYLGATFENFNPFFVSKYAPSIQIRVTLDAAHMLKNARNLIANRKKIWNSNNEIIEWSYFEKLAKIYDLTGRHVGTEKITMKHIDYDNNKMKVDLAAQTLSGSVCNALLLLQSLNTDFANCTPTAKYAIQINNVFDILNSNKIGAKGFKRPLNKDSIEAAIQTAKEFEVYVNDLFTTNARGKNVRIVDSELKTAFMGLASTLNNAIHLYDDLIKTVPGFSDFFTIRLSQDLLEILFGQVRAHLGNNTNPTTIQFEGILRKLLFQNEVKISQHANIQDNEVPLLFISSQKKVIPDQTVPDTNLATVREVSEPDQLQEESDPRNEDNISMQTMAFRAAFIESLVVKENKCEICKLVFESNDHTEETLVQGVTFLPQPCIDTISILKQADLCIVSDVAKLNFTSTCNDIWKRLRVNELFKNLNSNQIFSYEHKEKLVMKIIEEYLHVRFKEMAKQMNEKLKTGKQHKKRKVNHFQGI